ncbi:MAG TPA: hypothetical protein VF013_05420 [Candidatus Limnocylindria bacterium]
MGRLTRRLLAVIVAATATAAAAGPAAALVLLWSLTASPLTVTAATTTTFTLTATNLDPLTELGCLEVDLPASFAIVSVGTPSASTGRTWLTDVSGQAVVVYSDDGGGRLELGQSVTFTIRARPSTAGAYTWPNHAHDHQDCSGGDLLGTPITITVLPGLAPTPTPTPLPTPLPTLVPTPLPTLPPAPGGLVSPPSASAPAPSQPSATGLPSAPSAAPTATPQPAASRTDATPTPQPGLAAAGGGAAGSSALEVAGWSEAPIQLGSSSGAAIGGLGAWLIPAAIVGGPGLAVIAWVALQLVGALAWVPAIRRLRREEPVAER